jgi:hypothetical protein
VRVNEPDLPSADRIAHLLLALRADEQGFATVANQAFAGARWRVRRRLAKRMRLALDDVAGHAGETPYRQFGQAGDGRGSADSRTCCP